MTITDNPYYPILVFIYFIDFISTIYKKRLLTVSCIVVLSIIGCIILIKTMNLLNLLWAVLIIWILTIPVVIWEMIAYKHNRERSPSVMLNKLFDWFRKISESIGFWVARVINPIYYIKKLIPYLRHLEPFLNALYRLLKVTFFRAPPGYYFFKGFFTEYYGYISAFISCVLVILGVYYYAEYWNEFVLALSNENFYKTMSFSNEYKLYAVIFYCVLASSISYLLYVSYSIDLRKEEPQQDESQDEPRYTRPRRSRRSNIEEHSFAY